VLLKIQDFQDVVPCQLIYIVTTVLKDCSTVILRIKHIAFTLRFKLDTADEGTFIFQNVGNCWHGITSWKI